MVSNERARLSPGLLFWLLLLPALNSLLKRALEMVMKEEENSSMLPWVMHGNEKVKQRTVTCQLCPHSVHTLQAWACLVSSVIKDRAFSSGPFFEKNGREVWLNKKWKWKMTHKLRKRNHPQLLTLKLENRQMICHGIFKAATESERNKCFLFFLIDSFFSPWYTYTLWAASIVLWDTAKDPEVDHATGSN